MYEVKGGRIVSPGKFEGEPRWAPDFWEAVLEGFADDEEELEDVLISTIFVQEEHIQTWPELQDVSKVELWEDSQGFVHTKTTAVHR